jgi:transcriptional regulator with XRE-family HTH domain
MKERLSQFLQLEQLSPARFADILGVQRSGISHILSGRNKPGFDFIEKVLTKFPEMNAEWLITGKGKTYKEQSTQELTQAPLFTPQPEQTPATAPIFTTPPHSFQPEHRAELQKQPETHAISKIIILYNDKSFSEYRPE